MQQQWEYAIVTREAEFRWGILFCQEIRDAEYEDKVNGFAGLLREMGLKGWSMCAHTYEGGDTMVFQRPLRGYHAAPLTFTGE